AAPAAIAKAPGDGSQTAQMTSATAAHRVTDTVVGWPRRAAVSAYSASTAPAPAGTSTRRRRRTGGPSRSPASAATSRAAATSRLTTSPSATTAPAVPSDPIRRGVAFPALISRDSKQYTGGRMLGRIDHIGVAVEDIEAALPTYTSQLRLELQHREVVEEQGV